MSDPVDSFILTLACPDRPGIVHAVTGLLADHGANNLLFRHRTPLLPLDIRAVLARAVTWHAERRVLIDGHQTVVFR